MPLRKTLLVAVALSAFAAAQPAPAQESASGYRLRSERGQSRQLHVEPDLEPSGAVVSLSDEPEQMAAPVHDPRSTVHSLSDDGADASTGTELETADAQATFSPSPPLAPSPLRVSAQTPTYGTPAITTDAPPLPLAPRKESGGRQLAKPSAGAFGAVGSVGASLALVVGLFLAVVWVSRKLAPAGSAPLPKEAVELLGRSTINGQHSLQLVRIGGKLVLVALSPHGAATLTEILDPAEVERLTAICQRQRPESASASFREAVTQLEREPASRAFVEPRRPAANRPRTSLRS